MPPTYGELEERFIVGVKKDTKRGYENVAIGQFPLSKVPDGQYRIYYVRPKDRNRIVGTIGGSSKAKTKIQRVGKGKEFIIFEKGGLGNQT